MQLGIWVLLGMPLLLWGALYYVQCIRTSLLWRWGWLVVSLTFISFWQFGGGTFLLQACGLL